MTGAVSAGKDGGSVAKEAACARICIIDGFGRFFLSKLFWAIFGNLIFLAMAKNIKFLPKTFFGLMPIDFLAVFVRFKPYPVKQKYDKKIHRGL